MTTKHTPTPWTIEGEGFAYGSMVIRAGRGRHVAEVWNGGTRSPAVAEANAAFIVTAVNAHARLVEVLRRMVEFSDPRNIDTARALLAELDKETQS